MRFCVLGPLEAGEDGQPVVLGGGRQRALLALLLVHAGEVVSRDRLIDELWDGDPPASASQSLDVYVSRLRRALRAAGATNGVLTTRAPGYVLHAADTDAREFERLAADGRAALAAADPARAQERLGAALALWRGPAYGEVADASWARAEAARLEAPRMAATEDRIEARLALGEHEALVPELELLAARHPTRERLVGQLVLALYPSGRPVDALAPLPAPPPRARRRARPRAGPRAAPSRGGRPRPRLGTGPAGARAGGADAASGRMGGAGGPAAPPRPPRARDPCRGRRHRARCGARAARGRRRRAARAGRGPSRWRGRARPPQRPHCGERARRRRAGGDRQRRRARVGE